MNDSNSEIPWGHGLSEDGTQVIRILHSDKLECDDAMCVDILEKIDNTSKGLIIVREEFPDILQVCFKIRLMSSVKIDWKLCLMRLRKTTKVWISFIAHSRKHAGLVALSAV